MVRRRRRGRRIRHWPRQRLSATLPFVLCLALARVASAAAEPTPAPLSTAPPPSQPAAEPARALPAAVTICRGAEPTRCWVRAGESPCAPDGHPFRVVPDREADVARALADCRTPSEP